MDSGLLNIHEKPKRRRSIAEYMPFLPSLAAASLRLVHRTCRFTILGGEHYQAALDRGGPAVAACWHFAFPCVLYHFRDNGYLTIVSRSRDGELAARIVEKLGFITFRGSPGKGGVSALKGIISAFLKAPGGGFVADGSQGPARIVQKGLLVLALHSGCPIMPVSMAANPCWRFRSWDKTVVAKPFSRIALAFGPLIYVERGASPEKIEEYRILLQNVLNDITEQAERAVGGLIA